VLHVGASEQNCSQPQKKFGVAFDNISAICGSVYPGCCGWRGPRRGCLESLWCFEPFSGSRVNIAFRGANRKLHARACARGKGPANVNRTALDHRPGPTCHASQWHVMAVCDGLERALTERVTASPVSCDNGGAEHVSRDGAECPACAAQRASDASRQRKSRAGRARS
jgi:hypothetical protein